MMQKRSGSRLQPIDLILTEDELPTFKVLMARLHEHPSLSSIPMYSSTPMLRMARDSAKSTCSLLRR